MTRTPRLHFNPSLGPLAGFVADVDRETTTDGQVVRELLQNALDAGKSGTPVKVVLGRAMVAKQDLPLIGDYERAFFRAERTRSGKATPAEQNIIRRAGDMLAREEIPVLVCADNGHGLRPGDVAGLYGRGASEAKLKGGRGSIGLGHLRAFAPSMLRYLLYASRHEREEDRSETFAGQAILATASSESDSSYFDANGYVLDEADQSEVQISDTTGAAQMPDLMRRWTDWPGDGTGTVVAICGYEPLTVNGRNGQDVDKELCNSLLRAAAKNFAVSIWGGQFVVEWRRLDGASELLGKDTLRVYLEGLTRKQRRAYEKGPADLTAKLIEDTLRRGQQEDWAPGGDVKIWWQRLEMGDMTRVCVHRDGMFITHDCPSLERSDFVSRVPFFAVVDVRGEEEGSLAALVREAEGESHLQVKPSEIADKEERENLKRLLNDLGEFLRGLIPELDTTRFEPEELRLGGQLQAQVRQRPRLKPKNINEDENDDMTPDDDGDDEEEEPGGGGGGGPGPDPSPPKPRRVRRGVSPEGLLITSIRLPSDSDELRLRVAWQAPIQFATEDAGLRVCIRSGADETSQRDRSTNTEYLEVSKVKEPEGCDKTTPTDSFEWRLHGVEREGTVEIVIAKSEKPSDADIRALAVELVEREPLQKRPETKDQTAQKKVNSI